MLSKDWIEAFIAIVKTSSISEGSKLLGVTQPALSIRLKKLEAHLGVKLFTRSRKGISLTRLGVDFLRYTHTVQMLDDEFFSKKDDLLNGLVRIAGHFSVIQYAALPCLAQLVSKNPNLQLQLIVKEDDEIEPLLVNNHCDIALLQRPINNPEYLQQKIGEERYVMAEKKRGNFREDCFIDTDPTDNFSDLFFSIQAERNRRTPLKRSYMYNEIGILTGVELGLGRSIIFEPLVKKSKKVKISHGYKPLDIAIHLQCHKLSLYSFSVKAVFEHLKEKCSEFLRN